MFVCAHENIAVATSYEDWRSFIYTRTHTKIDILSFIVDDDNDCGRCECVCVCAFLYSTFRLFSLSTFRLCELCSIPVYNSIFVLSLPRKLHAPAKSKERIQTKNVKIEQWAHALFGQQPTLVSIFNHMTNQNSFFFSFKFISCN